MTVTKFPRENLEKTTRNSSMKFKTIFSRFVFRGFPNTPLNINLRVILCKNKMDRVIACNRNQMQQKETNGKVVTSACSFYPFCVLSLQHQKEHIFRLSQLLFMNFRVHSRLLLNCVQGFSIHSSLLPHRSSAPSKLSRLHIVEDWKNG